ncbi:hypothetical protein H5410_007121 [Solanum commersonii]|uniref:Uncharacterized protein n=1 Tax=Solanum commersonii TaxID=4109 RepID=A0A9J6AD90_SOLCO|nr:hypothetical protein H5410_007121 [Solanum commersonii]
MKNTTTINKKNNATRHHKKADAFMVNFNYTAEDHKVAEGPRHSTIDWKSTVHGPEVWEAPPLSHSLDGDDKNIYR